MNTALKLGAAGFATLMMTSGAALAQFAASAVTELNVREGPGPQFEVVTVIAANDTATVHGCLQDGSWCQLTYNGVQGWSHSNYLAMQTGGEARIVAEVERSAVPTVEFDSTAAGAAGGAIVGALVGGPIGAAIGGAVGAGIGSVSPPQNVTTYVRSRQPDTVYLEGEVVIGAEVPQTVTLEQIPDYEFDYVSVNGQIVLVDPGTRQIVHVYR